MAGDRCRAVPPRHFVIKLSHLTRSRSNKGPWLPKAFESTSTVYNLELNFINHQKSRKTVGGHRPSTMLAAITWVSMVILGAIRSIALVESRWLKRDEFIRGKAATKTTGIQWNHNKGQRTVNANNWQKRSRMCIYVHTTYAWTKRKRLPSFSFSSY